MQKFQGAAGDSAMTASARKKSRDAIQFTKILMKIFIKQLIKMFT